MKVKNYDVKYAITETSIHAVCSNNVSIIGAYTPMLDTAYARWQILFSTLGVFSKSSLRIDSNHNIIFPNLLGIWLWKILYNLHPFLGCKCFQGFSSHISIRTNFEH